MSAVSKSAETLCDVSCWVAVSLAVAQADNVDAENLLNVDEGGRRCRRMRMRRNPIMDQKSWRRHAEVDSVSRSSRLKQTCFEAPALS